MTHFRAKWKSNPSGAANLTARVYNLTIQKTA
jgi:hypothetical protein